ncbi:MlaE family lipid ABC transporter permease subunit [Palleronia sp. KMU-117]|uniref:MlaE family lipid ABC transporter permease subunit n=1 Tax=Palleronia sp. KMU-117 TaxID=3434108 RepID=UPI003D74C8D3
MATSQTSRDASAPQFTLAETDGAHVVTASGDLSLRHIAVMRDALAGLPAEGTVTVDLAGVRRLDTAGAWSVLAYLDRVDGAGGSARVSGASAAHAALIDTVRADRVSEHPELPARTLTDRLEATGAMVVAGAGVAADLLGYVGMFLARLVRAFFHPREFRLTSLVHHCEEVGLRALPIVSLMAFLIGVVLAFQGAAQLRQFGAQIFVVDLIAVSLLRELGILLTAIVVAGRTASAFTASIGSMKMREEVDAMRTLGIDPVQALIVPRVLALVITLPILGLIANLAGLTGGALMAWIELGISPETFQIRLATWDNFLNAVVGLSKAPVFAVLIGIVGCYAGMQVKGNAESLGLMTSKAVVAAIFLVIVVDAAFSIFFLRVGL